MESRKNWSAAFGSATNKHEDVVYDIRPDVAEAFIAAIRNQRNVQGPRHAQDFNDLTDTIAQASRIIQHMEAFREVAIVAADSTSAHADRKAIAIAAAMPPSRLYRVLEKFGRPRDRKAAADNPTSPAAKAMRDLADTLSVTPKESAVRTQRQALGKTVRARGGLWDTRRAVAALGDEGYPVEDKRARQILCDLADTGLLVKADPDSATYRSTEQ